MFDTITRDTLAGVAVGVPPPDTIDAFEALVGPALQRVRVNLYQSRTLATLRDALLPKLVSGDLRLKDVRDLFDEVIE